MIEPLTVHFDARGEVKLNGTDLPRGTYTFIAVKAAGQSSWVVVHAILYVR